jgi:Protein of unknown function (DUF4446)
VDELTTAPGIAALAAAGLALLALLVAAVAARRVRALRADRALVIGEEERDIVSHAAALDRRLDEVSADLEAGLSRLEGRDHELADGLAGAVTNVGVVRYDAMGEMTGQLSSSIALLDSARTGVVLSSIHHREQARVYAKPLVEGRSEFELSPEEEEAVEAAMRRAEP